MAASVTVYQLTRNPQFPGASNTTRSGDTEWKYVEVTYSAATIEVYMTPQDMQGVSISFKIGTGVGTLSVTDSPPDVVKAGNANWINSAFGTINASTTGLLTGYTAIQYVWTSGSTIMSIAV
jgi:hypothetical protein